MADGTGVRAGSVAMNRHPLGTRIYVPRGFFGRKRFVVRDRIGWGSELDFWAPNCGMSGAWGRRHVEYRIGWPRVRGRIIRVRSYLGQAREPRELLHGE